MFLSLISLNDSDSLKTFFFMCGSSCSRRYFLMARRRRTGTMRQRSDCLVAERRFSAVKSFLVVSGIRLAISCGGGGVVEVE